MEKRWVVKKPGDAAIVGELISALDIDENLANLLVQREISTYEEAKAFFRPNLNSLHDPFLMKDMDKAVERIQDAIKDNQKMLIYGDYDVDGTTAVALVYTFMKGFYPHVDFYIPDRYNEGYGISFKGIDFAAENGFSLILALDCGIKAIEKVVYAREKGIDLIIGDHHRPGDELPSAVAVLDPKRLDCQYPYKELSGCGIGFKLCQAYAQANGIPFRKLEQFLDLVVVSIASDIVPITGENRILAYFGLKLVNTRPRPGLESILLFSNIRRKDLFSNSSNGKSLFTKELTISDLVFLVGPRINAAGRIESGKSSVELLIAEDLEAAVTIAEQINRNNTERKNLDNLITQQALDMIKQDKEQSNFKSTVVYHPEWHKGVIGIVASRLTEYYYRPTIVLSRSNELITGSARSVKDFDIYDAIDACSDLLEHFGGHKYAAGLSLKAENFEIFRKRFEEIVASTITEDMLTPEIEIDACINLKDVNTKFYRILRQFAPFGPGNMSPVFSTEGVIDTGHARIVGNNHLKLTVVHPDISGFPLPAIAFQQGQNIDLIKSGQRFNICYHIEENEWNGTTSLQLNIKDIKPYQ
ncbi:MAG: single-stranded-DNA-specific exonuclease RecJ [Bacteroidales bacterium]